MGRNRHAYANTPCSNTDAYAHMVNPDVRAIHPHAHPDSDVWTQLNADSVCDLDISTHGVGDAQPDAVNDSCTWSTGDAERGDVPGSP